MLGTLAKWLRVCGFDTYYAKRHMKDKELIDIAKKENRVIITRDKELIYDARREQIKSIKIETHILDEQIKKILEKIKFDKKYVLSRCLVCNNILDKISKKEVKEKVPAKVYESHEKFFFCSKCDKIYWKGTHYNKMIEKMENYL